MNGSAHYTLAYFTQNTIDGRTPRYREHVSAARERSEVGTEMLEFVLEKKGNSVNNKGDLRVLDTLCKLATALQFFR